MTRRDDLARLRDAVKNGTADKALFDATWPHAHNFEHHHALQASLGDLNAALLLFTATLPKHQWHLSHEVNNYGYVCSIFACERDTYCATSNEKTPALTWLIAILDALIAQEDAQDRGMEG